MEVLVLQDAHQPIWNKFKHKFWMNNNTILKQQKIRFQNIFPKNQPTIEMYTR